MTILDLRGASSFCDSFLICTATNRRHARAIAEGILEDLRLAGQRPIGVEGMDASRWVLIDFGDVLVHVFDEPMRGFYDLDGLWADARRVPVDAAPPSAFQSVGQTAT